MKDVFTGLAALMAAIAALTSFLFSTDVTRYQESIARKRNLTADQALEPAQQRLGHRRFLLVTLPAVLAVVFCVCALFVNA